MVQEIKYYNLKPLGKQVGRGQDVTKSRLKLNVTCRHVLDLSFLQLEEDGKTEELSEFSSSDVDETSGESEDDSDSSEESSDEESSEYETDDGEEAGEGGNTENTEQQNGVKVRSLQITLFRHVQAE